MNNHQIIRYCDRAIAICLYLLIFFLPFAKAGVEIFAWTGIAVWLLKRAFGYRPPSSGRFLPQTPLNQALAIFILANVLSTIFSLNPALSCRALTGKLLKFFAIYFVVVETINSPRRVRNLLLVLIASATLMIADSAVQYIRGTDFLRGFTWSRLRASFATANDFGGWLIMVVPVLFVSLFNKSSTNLVKGRWRWGVGLLVVLLLGCLLLTYSRGAWLGLLVSSLLMGWYCFGRLTSRRKVILSLSFVGLIFVGSVLPPVVKIKIDAINDWKFRSGDPLGKRFESMDTAAFRERWILWKQSLAIVEDFPVLGTGLNTYSRYTPHYKKTDDGARWYAHNSYLQMATETGIVGLLSFLWFLLSFFKWGWCFMKRQSDTFVVGLIAGIAAFLVQSFLDTNLYALQLVVLFWFMLGLTVAVSKVFGETCPSHANGKTR